MSDDLVIHQFPATGQNIRVIQRDGEPLFCVPDVCRGLRHSNPTVALKLVDEDDKILIDLRETDSPNLNRTSINPMMWFITESGFYTLALASQAPGAKTFRRWVTHELLPSIRKTGQYQIPTQRQEPDELEIAHRYVKAIKDKRALQAQVAELEPDAARARRTMDAVGLALVGTIAKRFGIKEKALREFLYAEGLLIRGGSRHNEPMAAHVKSGHFEVKVTMVDADPDRPPIERSTTYITPKGESLIWKRLFDAGYVSSPTMPSTQLELIAA